MCCLPSWPGLSLPSNSLVVDASGGGTHSSVADAVAAASSGQTVIVNPGTYTETSLVAIPAGVRVLCLPGARIEANGLALLATIAANASIHGGNWVNLRDTAQGGVALEPASAPTPGVLIENARFEGSSRGVGGNATNAYFGSGTVFRNCEFVVTAAPSLNNPPSNVAAGIALFGGVEVSMQGCVGHGTRTSGSGTVEIVAGLFKATFNQYFELLRMSDCHWRATSSVNATRACAIYSSGIGDVQASACTGIARHTEAGVANGIESRGTTTGPHSDDWYACYFSGVSTGTGRGAVAISAGNSPPDYDVKRFHGCRIVGSTIDVVANATIDPGNTIWFENCHYSSFARPANTPGLVAVRRNQPPRRIAASATSVGTPASTAETDLHTYTIPARTLALNLEKLSGVARGTLSGNAVSGDRTLRVVIGSTSLTLTANVTAGTNVGWELRWDLIVTGDTAARLVAQWVIGAGTAGNLTRSVGGTLDLTGLDWSSALNVKITGQSATGAANDIVATASDVSLVTQ